MIKLKDVIHLYLGCQVRVSKKHDQANELTGKIVEVTSRSNHSDWVMVTFDTAERVVYENFNERTSSAHTYFIGHDRIKPVLRPLSDMTDDEGLSIFEDWNDDSPNASDLIKNGYIPNELSVDQFIKLLSGSFDIFGLIESGQAIDATKI